MGTSESWWRLTDLEISFKLEFRQYVDEVLEAVEQDENFNEMTAQSYEQKKSYLKSYILELSIIHNSLVDQYSYFIEQVDKNCPNLIQNLNLESSDSGSSPKFTTATGFDVRWHPSGGGFYLSKGKESSHSGSEASMSSVNKLALPPPVNDDALKEEEANQVLHEKISSLEEEVASLKQKLQSLTVENGELKQEVEDNVTDIRVYMSESKLEIKAKDEELQASKEFAKRIDEHMCKRLAEKISNETKHIAEISQLKSTYEKKEKIRNGVTEQLKNDVKEKLELVEHLSKNMADLIIDKSSQNRLILQLQTDLNQLKFENVWVRPSFDNIQKLTDEVKLKVVEVEREVSKQKEAMSNKDRK
ncbi:hypothetical protein L1987_35822 [Smallanthus sonchifolius]|uniref:Uncharacterized protein n=1 Tax=Smallanthus sonchifolius TaxID=185202 RepID=A0ACB9HBW6_9ASTR|nr:hypothetical protein L1987_35822 [Smallanthus sonchifolius]